jgi:beta-glucanase (GH16 family)
MMGTSIDTEVWPKCGEIDVMEYRGQEPTRVTGTLHGPGYSGAGGLTGSTQLPGGAAFDEAFHTFAVEWTPDWVAWELDGEIWQVLTPGSLPLGGEWVFDQPFFLLLNVAVGGNYVGAPDPAIFPPEGIRTTVDWVRVYRKAN